ncbi:MAG: plsC [Cytophagaceae bacterium]|jgi:1-acyl-sn-glycerol-3-phosphate acyltransferase|nr:plsC [Cytophagaceae bacterium]
MFKKIRTQIFRFWVYTSFLVSFLLLFPLFVLFIQRESWKKYGHMMNKVWAHVVFWTCGLRTDVRYKFKPSSNGSYVYCVNHSSYLDIPSLCYSLPGYFVLIGKASLAKVPLFGYMFTNLYIAVDRKSPKSRSEALKKSLETIDKGLSLAVFPEGTIPRNTPIMGPFKDGAFRTAIEKQVPVVPVAIINNWKILPDDGQFIPRLYPMITVICEPILTIGMTMDDVKLLQQKTYDAINNELKQFHPQIIH